MDEIKSPTRMSKSELKNALLSEGYTEEQLSDDQGNNFKRPVLLEKLQAHRQGQKGLTILAEIEESDDIGIEVGPDTKRDGADTTTPMKGESAVITITDEFVSVDSESEELQSAMTPNDPKWTQYVLGHFLDDEIDVGNPRVEGLRRVAGKLVGELLEEGCDLVAAPTQENNFRACAKAWGIFLTDDGRTKRFEALADASSENCLEDYATYLVAMADTRAKGRVFRNALCLRHVVAAEEVSKTMTTTADTQQGGAIHTSQITMIRMISERQNINIMEVLDNLNIKYKLNDSTGDINLQSLTYEDALMVAKKMREIREENSKND